MNSFANFIRTTISGGIIFLIPVTVLFIIFKKAHEILSALAQPVFRFFPDSTFGLPTKELIVIILLVAICLGAGMIFRLSATKKWMGKMEDRLFYNIPGYNMMKAMVEDTLTKNEANKIQIVLVEDGDELMIGFLSEENQNKSVVFIPAAPEYKEGEIKVFDSSKVRKLNVKMNTVVKIIRNYGKGLLEITRTGQ